MESLNFRASGEDQLTFEGFSVKASFDVQALCGESVSLLLLHTYLIGAGPSGLERPKGFLELVFRCGYQSFRQTKLALRLSYQLFAKLFQLARAKLSDD
jgi:hypothetical protein